MSMARQTGLDIFRSMLPELVPDGDDAELRDGGFADELGEIGLENLFGRLWGRDGLSMRDRSLITVAILIATRRDTSVTQPLPAPGGWLVRCSTICRMTKSDRGVGIWLTWPTCDCRTPMCDRTKD